MTKEAKLKEIDYSKYILGAMIAALLVITVFFYYNNYVKAVNPYMDIICDTEDDVPEEDVIIEPEWYGLVDYNLYIMHITNLYQKFLSDIEYTEELDFIMNVTATYPKEIHDVLSVLENYNNNYLINRHEKYIDVALPYNLSKLLDKVISVQKLDMNFVDAKNSIKSSVEILQEYFYSGDFFNLIFGAM